MRHLLSINDLSASDAIGILDTATELARINDGQVKKLPTLRGRTIVNLFAEDYVQLKGKKKPIKGYNSTNPEGWGA